jgi:hypothetical protein
MPAKKYVDPKGRVKVRDGKLCPKCGNATEQTYNCPGCDAEGCVEECNTGGNNCLCNECDCIE